MPEQTRFILNKYLLKTSEPPGMVLVDFIRSKCRLVGSTVACREGDCGACSVLIGEIIDGELSYRSITSCISPLANAEGRHVLTVEGLGNKRMNPIQEILGEFSATQCGFCTPGFIVSLAGFFLRSKELDYDDAYAAIDGNICRCTGYKSIERAVKEMVQRYQKKLASGQERIPSLVDCGIVPEYFLQIPERLRSLESSEKVFSKDRISVGGGTDLFVQKPEIMYTSSMERMKFRKELSGITVEKGVCEIGASTSIQEIKESSLMQKIFPEIHSYLRYFASTQIRQQATLAGNFVNASPIGDMTVFFLALDAKLLLCKNREKREVLLKDFFHDYKKTDLKEGEYVQSINFPILESNSFFNFEKVSKRTHLDIASVNSAIHCKVEEGKISYVSVSAGGVAAIPLYLEKTSQFFFGKDLRFETIWEGQKVAQEELSSISDVRGSAKYKRLLFRQLFFAHFINFFPEKNIFDDLVKRGCSEKH
jgi:xanthine dehydrogenase small subunit